MLVLGVEVGVLLFHVNTVGDVLGKTPDHEGVKADHSDLEDSGVSKVVQEAVLLEGRQRPPKASSSRKTFGASDSGQTLYDLRSLRHQFEVAQLVLYELGSLLVHLGQRRAFDLWHVLETRVHCFEV